MNPWLQRMSDAYREQYGEQCDALFEALASPRKKVALINPFVSLDAQKKLTEGCLSSAISPHAFHIDQKLAPFKIDGLLSHYFLDEASLVAPMALDLTSGMRVFDMCAAPGGKLLALIFRQISDLDFVACELSRARSFRLKNVLNDYLPKEVLKRVTIRSGNACIVALKQQGRFDAVLLDAPCSSEGHVASDERLLKKFVGLRKSLPKRQYNLLAAGILALKPGGQLVYATCSINRHENQDVVARLMKKKSALVQLVQPHIVLGTEDDYGVTILPHLHQAGPSFVAKVLRQ